MLSTFSVLLAGAMATTPAPAPAVVHVMKVTARDYAFEAPDTVLAGRTEIRLSNKGKELHHVWLVRLEAGKTAADFFAAMRKGGPQPAWAKDAGGPNSPVPEGESAAVVDLKEGNYVLACVIPGPDGKRHFMKGMVRPLTVVTKKATPTETTADRRPDVRATLSNYDFTLSRPLTAGRHVVRITNTAAQAHELFLARLAPGKTTQDALTWLQKMQGPPPLQPLGGIAGLGTGQSNDIAVDLTPGEYGLFCFIPDAKDGKPHVAHGMVKKITVR